MASLKAQSLPKTTLPSRLTAVRSLNLMSFLENELSLISVLPPKSIKTLDLPSHSKSSSVGSSSANAGTHKAATKALSLRPRIGISPYQARHWGLLDIRRSDPRRQILGRPHPRPPGLLW